MFAPDCCSEASLIIHIIGKKNMAWRCKCGRVMESLTYDRCLRCNLAKASGESLIRLKGDWVCCRCGKNNFARRITCFNVNCSSKSKRPFSHAVIEEENKPQEPGPSKTEALDDGAAKRIKLGDDVAQEHKNVLLIL